MGVASQIISVPIVTVDDVVLGWQPESVTAIMGFGEDEVKGIGYGGGATGITISKKVETMVGKFKFKLPSSVDAVINTEAWKLESGVHVVSVSGEGLRDNGTIGEIHLVMTHATLTNDPEHAFPSEAEYEWSGDPLISI